MERIEIHEAFEIDPLGPPPAAEPDLKAYITAVTTMTSPRTLAPLMGLVDTRAEKTAARFKERNIGEAAQLEASAQQAQKRAGDGRRELTQSEAELAAMPAHPDWIKVVVNVLCFVVGLGAEFALTVSTVPWALSIPTWGFLGIAVAAAPTVACLIFHESIERLLPLDSVAHAISSGSKLARCVRVALIVMLWCAVSSMVFYMLAQMAPVREAASRAKQPEISGDPAYVEESGDGAVSSATESDAAIIDTAIVTKLVTAVTYTVAVTSAVFYLLAMHDFLVIRRRRKITARIAKLVDAQRGLDQMAARLAAAALVRQKQVAEIEALVALEAKGFREEHFFELGQHLDTIQSKQTAEQRVEALLAGRPVDREHTSRPAAAMAVAH